MITASMTLPEVTASPSAVASVTTAAKGHQGIHGGRRELSDFPVRMPGDYLRGHSRALGHARTPRPDGHTPGMWIFRFEIRSGPLSLMFILGTALCPVGLWIVGGSAGRPVAGLGGLLGLTAMTGELFLRHRQRRAK